MGRKIQFANALPRGQLKKIKHNLSESRYKQTESNAKYANEMHTNQLGIRYVSLKDLGKSTTLSGFNDGVHTYLGAAFDRDPQVPDELSDFIFVKKTNRRCGILNGPKETPDIKVGLIFHAKTALWFNASNLIDSFFYTKYDSIAKEEI